MNISPVSFGSLLVCHIKDGKSHAPIPNLVKLSFNHNKSLNRYTLNPTKEYPEEIDGTIHNANKIFAKKLDEEYSKYLPKGSKNVYITEVKASINPRESETRYFITAATNKDEKRIHEVLSKSNQFIVGKFNDRK